MILGQDLILRILLPSPYRRGAGGEVTEEFVASMKQPCRLYGANWVWIAAFRVETTSSMATSWEL